METSRATPSGYHRCLVPDARAALGLVAGQPALAVLDAVEGLPVNEHVVVRMEVDTFEVADVTQGRADTRVRADGRGVWDAKIARQFLARVGAERCVRARTRVRVCDPCVQTQVEGTAPVDVWYADAAGHVKRSTRAKFERERAAHPDWTMLFEAQHKAVEVLVDGAWVRTKLVRHVYKSCEVAGLAVVFYVLDQNREPSADEWTAAVAALPADVRPAPPAPPAPPALPAPAARPRLASSPSLSSSSPRSAGSKRRRGDTDDEASTGSVSPLSAFELEARGPSPRRARTASPVVSLSASFMPGLMWAADLPVATTTPAPFAPAFPLWDELTFAFPGAPAAVEAAEGLPLPPPLVSAASLDLDLDDPDADLDLDLSLEAADEDLLSLDDWASSDHVSSA
jgi:hypothetical protein